MSAIRLIISTPACRNPIETAGILCLIVEKRGRTIRAFSFLVTYLLILAHP
jgi:hypothetical protein